MSFEGWVSYCDDCQKKLYNTRDAAKRAASKWHRGEHKAAFRCPVTPNLWHIGGLSPMVIKGSATRDQVYGEVA